MAVGALYALLAVTAGWWALALWPVPAEAPEWLARTRWVCFNAAPNGLPDASGWLLLVGQPIGMLAVLMAGWGEAVRRGLRRLAAGAGGRVALGATAATLAGGLALAGLRVATAERGVDVAALPVFSGEAPSLDAWPRLDREAPPLGLVDQHGERLELARLRGRPALVTFAFGHCESVCPAIVKQTVEAQRRVRELASGPERIPRVVVVTLDPWRDTPSRLPRLAEHWGTGEDTFLLSGEVEEVNRVLDGWNVARERDPRTGEVVHPPVVYVLDAAGRVAYAATGDVAVLAELVERS